MWPKSDDFCTLFKKAGTQQQQTHRQQKLVGAEKKMTQNSLVLTTHLQLTLNITEMTHDDSDVADKKF